MFIKSLLFAILLIYLYETYNDMVKIQNMYKYN